MICGEIVPEGMHVCPVCRREYDEPPAISRVHKGMEICPACGTSEALDAARAAIGAGMNDREWAEFKGEIVEMARRRR